MEIDDFHTNDELLSWLEGIVPSEYQLPADDTLALEPDSLLHETVPHLDTSVVSDVPAQQPGAISSSSRSQQHQRRMDTQRRNREKKRTELAGARKKHEQLMRRYSELEIENRALKLRARVLDWFVETSALRLAIADRAVALSEGRTPTAISREALGTDDVCLKALLGSDDAGDMSLKDFSAKWKASVLRMSLPLLKIQNSGQDPAMLEVINEAMIEIATLGCSALINRPKFFLELLSYNMDSQRFETPPTSFWKDIVRSANFNADQVEVLTAAWELYENEVQVLLAEHRRTLGDLMRADSQQISGADATHGCPLQRQIETYQTIAAELKNIVEKVMAACLRLSMLFMSSKVCEPLQKAQLIVQAYPFFPDALSIAGEVANAPRRK